jgi:ATP-dependent helicase/nuclease subunit A
LLKFDAETAVEVMDSNYLTATLVMIFSAVADRIRYFEDRIGRFPTVFVTEGAELLVRIEYPIDDAVEIELVENSRSTQEILDFSECSLTLPATQSEELDTEAIQENIVSLETDSEASHSRIEAITGDDEHKPLVCYR